MKPKEVVCPICSGEMRATIWGMKVAGRKIINYIRYKCLSCGCTIHYTGKVNIWDDET